MALIVSDEWNRMGRGKCDVHDAVLERGVCEQCIAERRPELNVILSVDDERRLTRGAKIEDIFKPVPDEAWLLERVLR